MIAPGAMDKIKRDCPRILRSAAKRLRTAPCQRESRAPCAPSTARENQLHAQRAPTCRPRSLLSETTYQVFLMLATKRAGASLAKELQMQASSSRACRRVPFNNLSIYRATLTHTLHALGTTVRCEHKTPQQKIPARHCQNIQEVSTRTPQPMQEP